MIIDISDLGSSIGKVVIINFQFIVDLINLFLSRRLILIKTLSIDKNVDIRKSSRFLTI